MALAHLTSQGRIGTLVLSNRMFVTAMGVGLAEDDGQCGDRLIAFHEEQARGGAALVITGVMGVAWPSGSVHNRQPAISDDRFLPGLKRLVHAVHAHGSKIAAQIHHGGLNALHAARSGHDMWGPSPPSYSAGDFADAYLPDEIGFSSDFQIGIKVLDAADIAIAIRQYVEGAVRAKEAGFDAIEIHGGHGYLLSSFLSPATNKRDDRYGGPIENRARLLLEVVAAVRAAVGSDYPMWVKIDSREVEREGGITVEDAKQVAVMLEAAGADAINVSAYHDVSKAKAQSASNIPHEPETNLPAAAEIKSQLKIPVIASGRVEMVSADAKIRAGAFDFLAMGRKILADPHLPRKVVEGRLDAVRPCIYCYTCLSAAYMLQPVRCAVNPETTFETLRPLARPPSGKHFVVVGGGTGGMEIAHRLDAAGNRVTLLERGDRLGGTLRFAALAYEPNERLLNWLRREVASSGVDVRLKTPATLDLIRSLDPDEVIVATGAVREMPPIAGADRAHVLSGDDMRKMMLGESDAALKRKTSMATRVATRAGAAMGLTANLDFVRRATHHWMPLGRRIVIIGGELVGLELAEFLMERKREVTVIEESDKLGRGLTLIRRARLLAELREHGVTMFASVRNIEIGAAEVTFAVADGRHNVPADHVIVAKGARGDSTLADTLRAAGMNVTEIGDGTGVSYIEGAVRGAARAVMGADAIPHV